MNKENALSFLRERIAEGETLYIVRRHHARSGMYRVLDVYQIKDNRPFRLTGRISDALEIKYDRRHEGLAMSGCGMDMGFEVVYNLSMALFNDGYKLSHAWL